MIDRFNTQRPGEHSSKYGQEYGQENSPKKKPLNFKGFSVHLAESGGFPSGPHDWLPTGIRLRRTPPHAGVLRFPCLGAIRDSNPPLPASKKRPLRGAICWRRVGDSNPRKTCAFTRFPGVLLKPLGQLSNWT